MIRYSQLLYFVEVVDRGSFSAAAKSLYVSQSALSQSLAGLEKELGAELIHRSKSGVKLTYFGHRVFEDAKALIGSFRDCESSWRGLLAEREAISGQVRVQCTPGVVEYLSASIVPELSAAFPGVELIITPSVEMRRGLQGFLKSCCALGIGACLDESWESILAQAEKAGCVCEHFSSERPQVLLSSRNALAQGDSLSLEQIGMLDLVCYSSMPRPRYLSLFRGTAARVPNKESAVRLVAGSDAAGVFPPSSIRRELSELRGRVRLLPLSFEDEAFLPVVHYLVHAPETGLRRPEQCTLELLRRFPYTG